MTQQQPKLAKFTHVVNDDMINTTFLYFDSGTVQNLTHGTEQEYEEFCIWLDEQDHKKLEAALRKEPYDCTCFNEKEMAEIRQLLESVINAPQYMLQCKPFSMSNQEWEGFIAKISHDTSTTMEKDTSSQ